jgi:hypothetical protein
MNNSTKKKAAEIVASVLKNVARVAVVTLVGAVSEQFRKYKGAKKGTKNGAKRKPRQVGTVAGE